MYLKIKYPRAFTLIELVVVIVILGILAAIGAFAYQNFIDSSRQKAVDLTAEQVAKSVAGKSAAEKRPPSEVIAEAPWEGDLDDSYRVTTQGGVVTVTGASGHTACVEYAPEDGPGTRGDVKHGCKPADDTAAGSGSSPEPGEVLPSDPPREFEVVQDCEFLKASRNVFCLPKDTGMAIPNNAVSHFGFRRGEEVQFQVGPFERWAVAPQDVAWATECNKEIELCDGYEVLRADSQGRITFVVPSEIRGYMWNEEGLEVKGVGSLPATAHLRFTQLGS